jgi:predicted adenylyl cyclase CyaB
LERKARHRDLAAARESAGHLGARLHGEEFQSDTYFHVPYGRLKLREIDGQSAALIWYDRPGEERARLSTYHLVPVANPAAVKAALTAALGVRGVVRKRRVIYLWHNIRIHLDEVEGLGTFVEFEAVFGPSEKEATAGDRLEYLGRALAIEPASYLAPSYVDLLGI